MSKQIHFFNEEIKYTVNEPGKICSWLVKSIKEEGKIAGNINFIITSDEILREINLKYLKKPLLFRLIDAPQYHHQ